MWYKNNEPLQLNNDVEARCEGERCILEFRECFLEDAAEYKCVARSVLGQAQTSCRLVVEREYNLET